MKMKKIVLSDEIRSIFPKSENEEYELATLESSLLAEGCRDSLIVWKEQNILVDGYRRYPLCDQHSIPFNVQYMSFDSIDEAKRWAAKNQMARRNLDKWQSCKLIIAFRQAYYKELADQNRKLSKGRGNKGKKVSDSSFQRIDVNTELAKESGVSRDTFIKAKYILAQSDTKTVEKLDEGKTTINKAYEEIRRQKKAEVKAKKSQIILGFINDLSKGVENQVLCMDLFEGLNLVEDGSVTLVLTSPPFNVGMPYKGASDSLGRKEYLKLLRDFLSAVMPKLRLGGRVVIEIENTRVKNEKGENLSIKYANEAAIINIAEELGYIYRDTIIWNKGNIGKQALPLGSYSPSNPSIRNTHSNVIVLCKGQAELPCVGGDPSIIDTDYYNHLTRTTWDIVPERHPYGTHCCPMPFQLAQQAIELFSYKNDLVLDPYGGSATTAIAALRSGRRFIHIDISETYCAEAKQRIEEEKVRLQLVKAA